MALEYRIHEHTGIIHILWEDHLPITDWVEMMDRVRADPRFKPGAPFLSDRRAVTAVATADDVKVSVSYIDMNHRELGHIRWAVLVNNLADFGMHRMAQAVTERFMTIAFFDEAEAAERWLLEPEQPA